MARVNLYCNIMLKEESQSHALCDIVFSRKIMCSLCRLLKPYIMCVFNTRSITSLKSGCTVRIPDRKNLLKLAYIYIIFLIRYIHK